MASAKQLLRRAKKKSLAIKLSVMSDNDVSVLIRKSTDMFLYSPEWAELKVLAKEKYGLVCACCGRENSKRFPINMDHVKPRKFYPELALDINNLQPLCGPCNKRKGNQTIDYR